MTCALSLLQTFHCQTEYLRLKTMMTRCGSDYVEPSLALPAPLGLARHEMQLFEAAVFEHLQVIQQLPGTEDTLGFLPRFACPILVGLR